MKKTGSEALQSAGKSSKSRTFWSSQLPLYSSKWVFKIICFDLWWTHHKTTNQGWRRAFLDKSIRIQCLHIFCLFHSTKIIKGIYLFTLSQALLSKSPSTQRNVERRTKYLRKSNEHKPSRQALSLNIEHIHWKGNIPMEGKDFSPEPLKSSICVPVLKSSMIRTGFVSDFRRIIFFWPSLWLLCHQGSPWRVV